MLGKVLVIAGALLLLLGILVWAAPSIPWLGRLPGDIRIERPGFRLYFPLTTCLLLSGLVSAALLLWSKLR